MSDYKLIVDKSAAPVGTGDALESAVDEASAARGMSLAFSVVSNPEFLKVDAAVDDFMRPDRVVIGSEDDRAIDRLRLARLASSFMKLMRVASMALAAYFARRWRS